MSGKPSRPLAEVTPRESLKVTDTSVRICSKKELTSMPKLNHATDSPPVGLDPCYLAPQLARVQERCRTCADCMEIFLHAVSTRPHWKSGTACGLLLRARTWLEVNHRPHPSQVSSSNLAHVHQARSWCLRCCLGVAEITLGRPPHRATQRARSRLRRPPLRSSGFVPSACFDSIAGP